MGVADFTESNLKTMESVLKEEPTNSRPTSNSINYTASDSTRGYQSMSTVISSAPA